MSVAVVVPFNPGDTHRDRNWSWLRQRWRRVFGWPVIESGCCPPWSKGEAVAAAVASTTAQTLVVADADVVCHAHLIDKCVEAVSGGAPWAMPHRSVHRLTSLTTGRLIHRPVDVIPPPWLNGHRHPAPRGGGLVVVSRHAWHASGGIDPRFEGWGGEDISWARALDTLAGPGAHLDGALFHLWHPRQERREGGRGSAHNEALAAAYLLADGDPTAMRGLIARQPA